MDVVNRKWEAPLEKYALIGRGTRAELITRVGIVESPRWGWCAFVYCEGQRVDGWRRFAKAKTLEALSESFAEGLATFSGLAPGNQTKLIARFREGIAFLSQEGL